MSNIPALAGEPTQQSRRRTGERKTFRCRPEQPGGFSNEESRGCNGDPAADGGEEEDQSFRGNPGSAAGGSSERADRHGIQTLPAQRITVLIPVDSGR